MHLFYVPTISTGCILPEEESQHAVKVLRLTAGDAITVIDGVGGFYNARITHPHHKRCEFEIIQSQQEFGKRPYRLHLAIAPTKNMDRIEWFVEKATEIGIDEITPVICRFSERKVIKTERLEKIAISAAKQSLKAYVPTINEACSFDELMKNHQASAKFIAHCYEADKRLLQNECSSTTDLLILIGPEGDFSPEEVEKAITLGFIPVSLGNSRLRTETAGVVACCTVGIVKA